MSRGTTQASSTTFDDFLVLFTDELNGLFGDVEAALPYC